MDRLLGEELECIGYEENADKRIIKFMHPSALNLPRRKQNVLRVFDTLSTAGSKSYRIINSIMVSLAIAKKVFSDVAQGKQLLVTNEAFQNEIMPHICEKQWVEAEFSRSIVEQVDWIINKRREQLFKEEKEEKKGDKKEQILGVVFVNPEVYHALIRKCTSNDI